ncbi:MAG TPA: A24 family peptidase [Candidatus Limnocylindrales bacterium]|nr:A24 family peptidase [Candidatus Limnocylindrales bacterium]
MDPGELGWGGPLLAAAAGAAVGSFANVVIYRSPLEGLSVLRPARSFCPHCRASIGWADNIPVVSWLLLRRRCRACRAPISARYPAVELLMALLFALAAWRFPPVAVASGGQLLVAFYLITVCVIVTFIDLEHQIIPDTITWPGMLLGVLASVALPALHQGHVGFRADAPRTTALLASLFGLAAGAGSLLLVGQLGNLFMRRKMAAAGLQDSMGWGDVKWMGLAGAFLGVSSTFGSILIGCFGGAFVGLLMIPFARLRGQDTPVGLPFGPFLALGMLCELFSPGVAWSLLSRLTGAA